MAKKSKTDIILCDGTRTKPQLTEGGRLSGNRGANLGRFYCIYNVTVSENIWSREVDEIDFRLGEIRCVSAQI